MTGTADDPAGSAPERPLGDWGASEGESSWSAIESEAGSAVPGSAEPGTSPQADRARRPSSLRAAVEAAGEIPRRKLTPPPFPKRHADAEPPAAGEPGAAVDPTPSGPSPVERVSALVRERPEVGLGIAFVGGILIATILKRLAR